MTRRHASLSALLDLGGSRSVDDDAIIASILPSTPIVLRRSSELQDRAGNRYRQADIDLDSSPVAPRLLSDVADGLIASGCGVVVSSRAGVPGGFAVGLGTLDCLRHHGSLDVPCDVGSPGLPTGPAAIRVAVGERIQFVQPLPGFIRRDLALAFDLRLACSGWSRAQRQMAILRLPSQGIRQAMVFRRPWEAFLDDVARREALDVLSWHLFPGAVSCLLPASVLELAVGFVALADLSESAYT